jgi:hypothetical protein
LDYTNEEHVVENIVVLDLYRVVPLMLDVVMDYA